MDSENSENSAPTPHIKMEIDDSPATQNRRRSAIHRKLQQLIDSGELVIDQPVFSPKKADIAVICLDDDEDNASANTTPNSRKRKLNTPDDWFMSKLAARCPPAVQEALLTPRAAEKAKASKYQEMKKMVEEKLAIQRREEMTRRHGFYNTDNEIFSCKDEEEEEAELTDEEEEEEEVVDGTQPPSPAAGAPQPSSDEPMASDSQAREDYQPQEMEEESAKRNMKVEAGVDEQEEQMEADKDYFMPSSDSEEDSSGDDDSDDLGSEAGESKSNQGHEDKKSSESPSPQMVEKLGEADSSPTNATVERASERNEDERDKPQQPDEEDEEDMPMAFKPRKSAPKIIESDDEEMEVAVSDLYASPITESAQSEPFAVVPSCSDEPIRRIKGEPKERGPELGLPKEDLPLFPVSEMNAPLRAPIEDFNEALDLCSGTFGSVAMSSASVVQQASFPVSKPSIFSDDQLFTADDDDDDNFASILDDLEGNALENNSEKKREMTTTSPPPVKREIKKERVEKEQEDEEEKFFKKRHVKVENLFDDEASLSGDDVGSDAEEGSDLDEYDAEEGDLDQVPDNEELRDNLVKQYIKQKNDEEERRMLQLQEHFFSDSDLHGQKDMDRSFRFRMRDDTDVDWKKLLGTMDEEMAEGGSGDVDDDEDNVELTQQKERKIEMMKWKLEQEKQKQKGNTPCSSSLEFQENFVSTHTSLLRIGQKIILKQQKEETITTTAVTTSTTVEDATLLPPPSPFSSIRRDSMLKNASQLASLLKESSSSQSASRPMFMTPRVRRN